MGGCSSTEKKVVEKELDTGVYLEKNDGDLPEYEARFVEDEKILGAGEFGQVKLVYERNEAESTDRTPYACKTLRKGAVVKGKTTRKATPKRILVSEIEIVRKLNGDKYCMRMVAVYETPEVLLLVTDCYFGGEMVEYVAKQKEDLRTEDVSRIALQLLTAVDHCAQNNVMHRDIKPANTMFVTEKPSAELRLIDFGGGTMKIKKDGIHTTYVGSPFCMSPEMFRKRYDSKTDVWSLGVVLYVLVAGFPFEKLVEAFTILMDSRRTSLSLKQLPGMPEDLPETYYEMLDCLLAYEPTDRKSAGSMLENDFVVFHKDFTEAVEEETGTFDSQAMPAPSSGLRQSRVRRTSSIALRGSVKRHSMMLDFRTYERSLTTILATMLTEAELIKLICILAERHGTLDDRSPTLEVVSVKELKDILNMEIGNQACVGVIAGVPNSAGYNGFAYHTSVLKEFVSKDKLDAAMNDTDGSNDSALAQEDKDTLIRMGATIRDTVPTSGNGGSGQFSLPSSLKRKRFRRAQSERAF